jgi:hypothetical protein
MIQSQLAIHGGDPWLERALVGKQVSCRFQHRGRDGAAVDVCKRLGGEVVFVLPMPPSDVGNLQAWREFSVGGALADDVALDQPMTVDGV